MNNKNKIITLIKQHPIIANIIAMCVCVVIVINGLLIFIDVFTEHGKYQVVPTVKGLNLDQAIAKLDETGFKWDISDSIYSEDFAPGVVVDQTPKESSKIKSNRIVYLVINAFAPRSITFPNVLDISERQAVSLLDGLGVRNVTIETAYSPYKGLVIDCKLNGRTVRKGEKISTLSQITLVVGDGGETPVDTLPVEEVVDTDADTDEALIEDLF